MNDKDEAWIEARVQRMNAETPATVIETFNAEHEETNKVTFEQFWEKRYRAERTAWHQKEDARLLAEQQRQEAKRKEFEREVLELWGVNYFVYLGGKRLDRPKHLKEAIKCGSCGAVVEGMAEGSLRDCYERRHMVMGGENTYSGETLPFKLVDDGRVCPKCKAATVKVVYVAIL